MAMIRLEERRANRVTQSVIAVLDLELEIAQLVKLDIRFLEQSVTNVTHHVLNVLALGQVNA